MIVEMIPVFVILFLTMALNLPIYIALLSSGIYMQLFINNMSLQSVVSAMFESVTKTSLMAIPFFILAGSIMAKGTLGERLIDFCSVFLRSVRAGMAMACLIANAIFGAISGSPPAATATFSKILYEPLEKTYGERRTLGLIVGAAGLSSIIPPSVGMIIYGVVAEVSIAKLFMAGLLPGLVMVIIFAIYLLFSCPKDTMESKASRHEKKEAFKSSILVLILPIIILGGIYGGVFTPMEAGALSAAYSAIVSYFILKDMNFLTLLKTLKEGTITSVKIYILIASSGVFAQALTVTQFPQHLASLFEGVSAIGFLAILNIILLIFGCFFDSSSAILIMVPMLAPTSMALGIDPIHLGIVYVVNLTVGMITPPFGLNLFVCQGVLGKEMGTIVRAVVPYVILYIIGIIIITYIPIISTILPNTFM
ncbi:MAG: TRAP transporter large permease [Clostridiales bacterium]|nr:TRAP transporter large permease [Clostridiales bacterium]